MSGHSPGNWLRIVFTSSMVKAARSCFSDSCSALVGLTPRNGLRGMSSRSSAALKAPDRVATYRITVPGDTRSISRCTKSRAMPLLTADRIMSRPSPRKSRKRRIATPSLSRAPRLFLRASSQLVRNLFTDIPPRRAFRAAALSPAMAFTFSTSNTPNRMSFSISSATSRARASFWDMAALLLAPGISALGTTSIPVVLRISLPSRVRQMATHLFFRLMIPAMLYIFYIMYSEVSSKLSVF